MNKHSVAYCTTGQTTKYSQIYKNIIYIYILRQWWLCVGESSHISFFCGGDTFYEVVWWLENMHREPTGLLEWPVGLSFQVPCGYMNILFAHVFFCLWLVIGTYILLFFFLAISWSYLQTKISVTLSIGNKLYSRHHLLYFSFLWKPLCWCYLVTALNLLRSSTAHCR